MESKNAQLLLTISPPQGADEQELDELSQQLRAALLESDADAVEPARASIPAPTGAKGDPVSLAALVVMIAPRAVDGLIHIIQDWVSRHERATVTIKHGDSEVAITGDSSVAQQQFAETLKLIKN